MGNIAKDVDRLKSVVKAVNDLVAMNLMQPLTSSPIVYVHRVVVKENDRKYLRNWCQNVMRVWVLTYSPQDLSGVELAVFDKESGDMICRYSESKGLMFF